MLLRHPNKVAVGACKALSQRKPHTAKTSPLRHVCSMSRSHALTALSDIAAGQWGLVTTAQARRFGVSTNDLSRLHAIHVLRRIRHGVYALVGAPASSLEAVRAEWLATEPLHSLAERTHNPAPVVVCDETTASIQCIGDFTSHLIRFNSERRLQTSQPTVHISHRTISRTDLGLDRWADRHDPPAHAGGLGFQRPMGRWSHCLCRPRCGSLPA